jgi:hypothetical protein
MLSVPVVRAQPAEVTIRQINAIPQEGIDAVKALGGDVTQTDITTHVRSEYNGQSVRITGVVLSDPRYSGLSSVSNGTVSRIHFFVRDTTAATLGPAGNDIQVVDGNYAVTGSLGLFVGDVVTMVGDLAYFGTGIQFSPQSVEIQGTIEDLDLPASILDPVTVTIDQINLSTGDFLIRANWDNFSDLNQQYVRIEGVQVWQSPNRTDSRPNWVLRDPATDALIQNDDMSLAYRNDKSDYPGEFFATNNFTAPPPGASVNVQGFALMRSNFDPLLIGDPAAAVLKIVPWTPDDLEITETPPNISNLAGPTGVPGDAPQTVSADVVADQTRTITEAKVVYWTSSDPTEMEVAGVPGGDDSFTFEIPAQPDGDFVTWRVEATDSEDATSVSTELSYRILFGGITEIRHIQQTPDASEGSSPFVGQTVPMDLTAILMTDPANAGTGQDDVVAVQDSPETWSGIAVYNQNALFGSLSPGDAIHVTQARVFERFGMTQLRDVVFTVQSAGNPLHSPFTLESTSALADRNIAESLEGMFVRVEDVTVFATNADAPSGPFGEFLVTSDGTGENAVRVNDQSTAVSYAGNDPGTVFSVDQLLDFVQGTLWYSFSNFKIEPGTFADIQVHSGVAVEDETVPTTSRLHQNFPNPFNPTTAIRYDVATTGRVTLAVYDALGRMVAMLENGERAVGTYTSSLDASHLASGLYVYRLTTADRTVSRTMTLVK